MGPGQDRAETLALTALVWVLGQPDILERFMTTTGFDPETLRARAGDPEFLGSVLDFLLTDDALIVAFCESERLPYEAPMQARLSLPGGQHTDWT